MAVPVINAEKGKEIILRPFRFCLCKLHELGADLELKNHNCEHCSVSPGQSPSQFVAKLASKAKQRENAMGAIERHQKIVE